VPPRTWARLVPSFDEEPRRAQWWETVTPLAADCDIALEKLHCTPGEFYARTSWRERLLIRLHLGYRHLQEEAGQQQAEHLREAQAQVLQQGPMRG
jgi:hypothetical protein